MDGAEQHFRANAARSPTVAGDAELCAEAWALLVHCAPAFRTLRPPQGETRLKARALPRHWACIARIAWRGFWRESEQGAAPLPALPPDGLLLAPPALDAAPLTPGARELQSERLLFALALFMAKTLARNGASPATLTDILRAQDVTCVPQPRERPAAARACGWRPLAFALWHCAVPLCLPDSRLPALSQLRRAPLGSTCAHRVAGPATPAAEKARVPTIDS